MAHEDNGLGSATKLPHAIHAAVLEIEVTCDQRLVEQEDLMIHRRSNRELQPSGHARGVGREWQLNMVGDTGEIDDLVDALADGCASHAQGKAPKLNVLSAGESRHEGLADTKKYGG